MKKIIFIGCLWCLNAVYAQDGLYVNGATLTITEDAVLRVQDGDLTLTNDALITNQALISIDGSWFNNNPTNQAFSVPSEGTVLFKTNDLDPVVIGGANPTVFYNLALDLYQLNLEINTSVGGEIAGTNEGVLTLNASFLGLNDHTLSITNSAENAIVFTSGNIVSENVLNESKVSWQTSPSGSSYVFPFGTRLGQAIPITVERASGDLGMVSLSTYIVEPDMTPYPTLPDPVSSVIRSDGIDVSAISITRFWQLDKTGNGVANLVFAYTENELPLMEEANFTATRFDDSSGQWEIQGTSVHTPLTNEIYVTNVSEFSPWAINGQTNDYDDDTVADAVDIDNDNDGIIDEDEGVCTPVQSGGWTVTGTTALYDFGNGVIAKASTTSSSSFSSGNFNGSGTGFWSDALSGDVSLEGNYTWNSSLTISFEDGAGNPVKVEDPILHFDRIGSSSNERQNSARVTLQGGLIWHKLSGTKDFLTSNTTAEDAGGNLNSQAKFPYTTESSKNNRQGTAAGSLQIEGYINEFTLEFTQVNGFGSGGDGIELILMACHSDDADNDAIPNYLDLDSDGDGIPDNVEAFASLDYEAPGAADTDLNGLDDVYEVSPGSGEGISVVNTDGLDGPDYLDIDADNDGFSDTVEAGLTLANADDDGDGLDNATDTSIGFADPGGTIDDVMLGPVILPDTDGDANSGGDVDFRDVSHSGDLKLVKGVNNSTPEVGDEISFRLRIINQGTTDVTSIVVRDIIPEDFVYGHPNYTATEGTVSFVPGSRTFEWDLNGYTLTAGNSIDLTYVVRVDVCGEFTNRAEIISSSISDVDSTASNGN